MRPEPLLAVLTALATLWGLAGANHASPPEQPPFLERRQNANNTATGGSTLAYSPPFYPSPWMNPKAVGWEEAYAKARDFVSQMTLLEKVNLTTGVGYAHPSWASI